MLTQILMPSDHSPAVPKEGDLYKEVNICGTVFRLEYGYYESFEREGSLNDPMPIYPDFIKSPQYTAGGIPIITAMQNTCAFYIGKSDVDSSCSGCAYFKRNEDLFGLCDCPQRRQLKENRTVENSE